jgi:hypothetical protein
MRSRSQILNQRSMHAACCAPAASCFEPAQTQSSQYLFQRCTLPRPSNAMHCNLSASLRRYQLGVRDQHLPLSSRDLVTRQAGLQHTAASTQPFSIVKAPSVMAAKERQCLTCGEETSSSRVKSTTSLSFPGGPSSELLVQAVISTKSVCEFMAADQSPAACTAIAQQTDARALSEIKALLRRPFDRLAALGCWRCASNVARGCRCPGYKARISLSFFHYDDP